MMLVDKSASVRLSARLSSWLRVALKDLKIYLYLGDSVTATFTSRSLTDLVVSIAQY
jgi:hypothetical protein